MEKRIASKHVCVIMEIENIRNLLVNAQTSIKHHNEIAFLKGETFNVFSILKMERRENETHSAFLNELLSPKGSHLKGSLFLKLFLDTINFPTNIDVETAYTKVEFTIGPRNDVTKEGGRVDIVILDKSNNCMCIENKIDVILPKNSTKGLVKKIFNFTKPNDQTNQTQIYG